MQDWTFDRIAKRVAAQPTRRRFLGGIGALAAGGPAVMLRERFPAIRVKRINRPRCSVSVASRTGIPMSFNGRDTVRKD